MYLVTLHYCRVFFSIQCNQLFLLKRKTTVYFNVGCHPGKWVSFFLVYYCATVNKVIYISFQMYFNQYFFYLSARVLEKDFKAKVRHTRK